MIDYGNEKIDLIDVDMRWKNMIYRAQKKDHIDGPMVRITS